MPSPRGLAIEAAPALPRRSRTQDGASRLHRDPQEAGAGAELSPLLSLLGGNPLKSICLPDVGRRPAPFPGLDRHTRSCELAALPQAIRAMRWQTRGRRPMERRRVACLTMMRDETFFFPIWYRHYASIFGHENLYVIDHLSQLWPQAPDADRPLNVLHIPVEFDRGQRHGRNRLDGRRFRLISTMVEALLAVYDTVIFNDTDEIFITDPDRYRDVGAFLDAHGDRHPAFGGIGLEVVHDPVAEPPFDPALPALGQRSTFVYSLHYAKPHIVSRPCRIGAHGISQPWALSRDLYLVHLKNVDADHLAERQ